jgi:transposase
LDVALRPSGESFRVGNDQGGISALVERLSGVQPELVVLEASGGYETAVVAELAAASIAVTVVNPRQVRDFARAIGQLEKSDVLDRILALFAERVRPEVRPLADERTRDLQALVARRRQLVEMRDRGLRSAGGAAHSEGAAADAVLDEHSSKEYRSWEGLSEVYYRRDYMEYATGQKVRHQRWRSRSDATGFFWTADLSCYRVAARSRSV